MARAGHGYHRGSTPGGALWFDHTPIQGWRDPEGPLFIRWQEVRFRGKGSKNGSGSNDTARNGGLGKKGYRGAWGEGEVEEKAV